MTAIWAFLRTPAGRWLAICVAAAFVVAVGIQRHSAAVARVRQYAVDARDEMWRGKLQAAESAYQQGIEDEAKRRELDAADAEKAETIIERVVKVSASARDCNFDQATADALNELRGTAE